jgi:uncharacterized membrane protein
MNELHHCIIWIWTVCVSCIYVCVSCICMCVVHMYVYTCLIQVHNCKQFPVINSLTLSMGTLRTLRIKFL